MPIEKQDMKKVLPGVSQRPQSVIVFLTCNNDKINHPDPSPDNQSCNKVHRYHHQQSHIDHSVSDPSQN